MLNKQQIEMLEKNGFTHEDIQSFSSTFDFDILKLSNKNLWKLIKTEPNRDKLISIALNKNTSSNILSILIEKATVFDEELIEMILLNPNLSIENVLRMSEIFLNKKIMLAINLYLNCQENLSLINKIRVENLLHDFALSTDDEDILIDLVLNKFITEATLERIGLKSKNQKCLYFVSINIKTNQKTLIHLVKKGSSSAKQVVLGEQGFLKLLLYKFAPISFLKRFY